MPYVLPNFNLRCDIGPNPSGASWPPTSSIFLPRWTNVPCALVYGRRVNVASTGGTATPGVPILCMSLLLNRGFDIRGLQGVSGIPDIVEVPVGSGRYYGVPAVDDIGKGYPNEHRTAVLFPIPGTWAEPYA